MKLIALEMIRQGLPVNEIVTRLQSMQVYIGNPASEPESLIKYVYMLKGKRYGRKVD